MASRPAESESESACLAMGSLDRELDDLKLHLASLHSQTNLNPKPLSDPDSDSDSLARRYLNLSHKFNSLFLSNQPIQPISSYHHNRLLASLNNLKSQIDALHHSNTSNPDRPLKKFSFSRPLNPTSNPTPPSSSTFQTKPSSAPPLGPLSGLNAIIVRPTTTTLAPLHSLVLSDLSGALLDLRPLIHLGSLHLARLRHSALVAPPLSGSAFCDQLHRSLLLLVAQQLRIHRSAPLALLLHTHTPPVLEASSEITLAPYPARRFPVPCLAPMPASQHALAQDFDHPSSTDPSPNLILMASSPVDEDTLADLFAGPPLSPGNHYAPMPEPTRDALRAVLEKLFPDDHH